MSEIKLGRGRKKLKTRKISDDQDRQRNVAA
jgi:hypothetical protein